MKRPSDFLRLFALAAVAAFVGYAQAGSLDLGPTGSAPELYRTVPQGDPAYAQLRVLSNHGYLSADSIQAPLTRYDVARLILRAKKSYDETRLTRVAQADLDLSGETSVSQPAPSGNGDLGLSDASATSQEDQDAAKAFNSLQQAYDYELDQVKGQVKELQTRVQKMDDQNYRLWKQVRGLSTNPSISLHGDGRSASYSKRSYGDLSAYPSSSIKNYTMLNLMPSGVISKELSWYAICRIATNMAPSASTLEGVGDKFYNIGSGAGIEMERITVNLNPDFMEANFGDFDLAWTPFTLWNRNCDLDYEYVPGVLRRQDQYKKDPYYIQDSPKWPLRGLRVASTVMWPNSPVLDSFKVESFVHMLRSGYAGGYVAFRYTGWLVGARSEIKAKKYLSVGAYGLMLDEPLNTDDPTAVYKPYDASTWAQRYTVGSLTPKVTFEVNDDLSLGIDSECAGSKFGDDKINKDRKVQDWALFAGPAAKYKNSTLSIKYLNVGYGFYSPMAQLRQEDDYLGSMEQHPVVLSSDIGIDALGRPSAIFKYYDRLNDNVFPYGFSTPNRKGVGGDLDLKALDKDALSIKAKVYAVKEFTDNFVVNKAGTDFQTVDGTAGAPLPKRKFVYVNVGPQLNIASLIGWNRRLDAGFNVRKESTKSDIGTLNSTSVLVGGGVGLTRWLEAEIYGGFNQASGYEAALNGIYARTSYPYDNTDLGKYVVENMDSKSSEGGLSLICKIDRHSKLTLDGTLKKVSSPFNTDLNQHYQTLDLIYEIIF